MADDEEFAEIIMSVGDSLQERAHVPLVGYSETVVRLDNVFDAIMSLNETLIAVYSKRGGGRRPVRADRPETARERVKRMKTRAKLQSIEDQMTGGR